MITSIKSLFYGIIIIVLASCHMLKSPTGSREFFGTVKTCTIDSTVILNSETIIIVDKDSVNINCVNRLRFDTDIDKAWPVRIFFDFKIKEYWYMFNPELAYDKDKRKIVTFSTHDGDLKVNKKAKTIVLKSITFPWEKTFSYTYNKAQKTLTLKEIKKDYKQGL